jgi:NADPH:quinone reductase-like Zn-dependent oxidoreductase
VEEAGPGVSNVAVGDEVIGFTHDRVSQAEFVLVESGNLVPRPKNVSWEQAGALFVAGTTAYAAVRSVGLSAGDTVVVSGAARGVGSIAVQLARNAGAKVIGLASEANRKWLAGHGVIPLPMVMGWKIGYALRRVEKWTPSLTPSAEGTSNPQVSWASLQIESIQSSTLPPRRSRV